MDLGLFQNQAKPVQSKGDSALNFPAPDTTPAKANDPAAKDRGESFARMLSNDEPNSSAPTAKDNTPKEKFTRSEAPTRPEAPTSPSREPSAPRTAPRPKTTSGQEPAEAPALSRTPTPISTKDASTQPEDEIKVALANMMQAAATEEDKAGQENLAVLVQVLADGAPVKQKAPILAFLTGDLSGITPAQIPSLVLKNPFVAKALQSPEILEFLNQETTVEDILTSLNFDEGSLGKARALGLNLSDKTTPRKLLKSLGVDAQIVLSELQNLKSNLQMDGLAPYMERARQISPAAMTIPVGEPPVNAGLNLANGPAPGEVAIPTQPKLEVGNQPQPMPQKTLAAVPTEPASDAENLVAVANAPKLINEDPYATLGTKMAELDTTQTESLSKSAEKPEPAVDSSSQDESFENPLFAPLKFEKFGATVKGEVPAAAPRIAAIEQTVLAKEVSASIPEQEVSTEPAPLMDNTAPEIAAAPVRLSADDFLARLAVMKNEVKTDAPDTMLSAEVAPLSLIPEEQASLGFDGGEEFTEQPKQFMNEIATVNIAEGPTDFGSLQTEFVVLETPAQEQGAFRQELMNKVFDRATMMLNQNGGSMRLDLGAKELGVLDLAMNVENDQLSLRIIASSENVREILTQDIPRLRESLNQQNLNLKNIEIAVQEGNAWASHSGQGGFRDQQNFEGFKENVKGVRDSSRTFASRARGYMPARANLPSHLGQIQVLV